MTALEIDDLRVRYGHREVVSGVSLVVQPGRTLGLVGESGSGKSTVANAAVGLAGVHAGDIRVHGVSTLGRSREARTARRRLQLVFQDPFSALDPRMSIGDSIAEGLKASGRDFSRSERRDRVIQWIRRGFGTK